MSSSRPKRSLSQATASNTASPVISTPSKRPRRGAKDAISGVKKEEEGEASRSTGPPTPAVSPSPSKSIAERKVATYRASQKSEPFPNWPHPTHEEAQAVAAALGQFHNYADLPRYRKPEERDSFGGCGATPSILDATIRTVLSCNTSSRNSTAAHKSLVARFGRMQWQAILDAPPSDLVDAIRCGGLANNKAATIRGILVDTQERFGVLSLDHLHGATDSEVMETLVSFKGVGPKVASCVMAFCLGRQEMAVDTHVARLSIALGWVPSPKATRDQIYYHLHNRVPGHLKYPLHVLLVKHGKLCASCSAKGFATEKDDVKHSDDDEVEETKEEIKNRPCPLRAGGFMGKKGKAAVKVEAKQEVKDEEDKKDIGLGLDFPVADAEQPAIPAPKTNVERAVPKSQRASRGRSQVVKEEVV